MLRPDGESQVSGPKVVSPPVCPQCDGQGQVHHGEGALSYVTLCKDEACWERRQQAWDGVGP